MEKQRWEESEKRRAEERRSEERRSQKKEDAGAQKGRKVAKHWAQYKETSSSELLGGPGGDFLRSSGC